MTKTLTIDEHVTQDFPKENEVITSSHYTLRFSASYETKAVEVSIDNGPWKYCRQTDGYFWFDWTNYTSGRHEIRARARLQDNETDTAAARKVRVELPQY